jgi:hypothetical protein
MTILVDQPRWAWRGTVWSHLVSDTGIAELHAFARSIRMRYLSYQGDHYDLPAELFERAVSAGAQVVDSRVLVARLREAGLRRRAGKSVTAWSLVAEGSVAVVADHATSAERAVLEEVASRFGPAASASLLERPAERVGLLTLDDHRRRFDDGQLILDADSAVVESDDPRGHTLEVVWRSGAGRELDHG